MLGILGYNWLFHSWFSNLLLLSICSLLIEFSCNSGLIGRKREAVLNTRLNLQLEKREAKILGDFCAVLQLFRCSYVLHVKMSKMEYGLIFENNLKLCGHPCIGFWRAQLCSGHSNRFSRWNEHWKVLGIKNLCLIILNHCIDNVLCSIRYWKTSTNRMHSILNCSLKFYTSTYNVLLLMINGPSYKLAFI